MGPVFQQFHLDEPLRVYVRNLPHWRQRGVTYFVTFRQADSIPEKVLAEWFDLRDRWYRAHKLDPSLKATQPDRFAEDYRKIPAGIRVAFERVQARMLHEELDRCHGSCLLLQAEIRTIVVDSLAFFHGQRLWLGDVVIMPNHVHALIVPCDGWELEDLLGSIKKWTSREIGNWLATQPHQAPPAVSTHLQPHFWQHESYDRIVRDAGELTAFRRYVLKNPESANLKSDEFTYRAANWLDEFAPRESLTADVVPSPDYPSREI